MTSQTGAGTLSTSDKVVVHYADGRVAKGHTDDFNPALPTFTLVPIGESANSAPVAVRVADLKAVFFVKDFAGDPEYTEWKRFVEPRLGQQVALKFQDGEVMVGARLPLSTTEGFLLFPADRASNNEKVFVVNGAISVVEQLPD